MSGSVFSTSPRHDRLSPWAYRLLPVLLLLVGLLLLGAATVLAAFRTDDPAYVKGVNGVNGIPPIITPLLTVGEDVPRTSGGGSYRMIGIPDGLGAYEDSSGNLRLLVNHELGNTVASMPIVGGQPYTGAFVSEYILDPDTLQIISGDLAYTTIYSGTNPAPLTGAFSRFCSGWLGGSDYGFDRPIYFTGEESSGTGTFDGRGGVAVAILDDAAYVLPDLSHFSKENVVPAPHTGARTVLFGLEDGPGTPVSQLYMYVGAKNPSASHPLERNGLVGGALYVFASHDPTRSTEATFRKGDGALAGHWVEIPNAAALNDVELEAAAQAAGAFGFVRVEDGTAPLSQPGTLYFATTGSTDPANQKGRFYRLTFDAANPATGAASLTVLLEGDAGDPIVNPDNVDVNGAGIAMIQEDPNAEYRGAGLGRDSAIWRYDTLSGDLIRVAEIDQTAVPAPMRGEWGEWETSGILDASAWLGEGAWLFDVQAHTLDSAEASQLQGLSGDAMLVQGGQLLVLSVPSVTAVHLAGLEATTSTLPLVGWALGGVSLAAATFLVLRRKAQ